MDNEVLTEPVQKNFLYEKTWGRFLLNCPAILATLVLVLLMILIGYISIPQKNFLALYAANIFSFRWVTYVVILPYIILILASGNLDLSIGSIIGLTISCVAIMAPNMGLLPAIIISLGIALIIGVLNGLLVSLVRINSAIITLGMAVLLRGINYVILNGKISLFKKTEWLSLPAFNWTVFAIALILGLVLVALHTWKSSSWLKTNPDAIWKRLLLIGVPYMLSGIMAGVVGLIYLGKLHTVSPVLGNGFELEMVVIAILSGTPLYHLKINASFINLIGGIIASLGMAILPNLQIAIGNKTTYSFEIAKGVLLIFGGMINYVYYLLVIKIPLKSPKETAVEKPVDLSEAG